MYRYQNNNNEDDNEDDNIGDIKCPHHPQQDIILICKQCDNNQPACRKCITTIHQDHGFMDIDEIDTTLKNKIRVNYYNNTLPQLYSILVNCKSKLEESNNHYSQIQDQHSININKLELEFKNLKSTIKTKENELKEQLLEQLDENKNINIINSEMCNNVIATINNINNKTNHNDNSSSSSSSITDNQFKEILKRDYQLNNFTTNNNVLKRYNIPDITISEESINLIKDNINKMVQIVDKKILKNENGLYKWINDIIAFKIYKDGDYLINDSNPYLAIQHKNHLPPTIPSNVQVLLLPDDFDQPINSLPSHIRTLYLFNIKLQLKPGSIPNSISNIIFCDGFSQRLNNGVIHANVTWVCLGDTLYPLEANSIPNPNLVTVSKMKSHKHQIPSCYTKIQDCGY